MGCSTRSIVEIQTGKTPGWAPRAASLLEANPGLFGVWIADKGYPYAHCSAEIVTFWLLYLIR